MRETTWLAESKDKIQEVAAHLLGRRSNYADFSVSKILKTNVRVYANSDLYLHYLNENFQLPDYSDERPSITLYYDYGRADSLKAFGYNLNGINTPCIGLFDEVSSTGLITGLDDYGLMKSTVIGIHSRLLFVKNWIPIHGAVINLDGMGVMIIGYHGAGKSTALLNIIHRTSNETRVSVLTDDWSVARKDGSLVKVHSIEQKMSFSKSLACENPELDLLTQYNKRVVDGIGKVWIDIDEVFGNGSYAQETTLKKVLVFSNNHCEEVISPIPIKTVADLLVDSSYHMPDTGKGTKERLLFFWNNVLTEIDCVQINNRHIFKPKDKIYGEILDYLVKKQNNFLIKK
jgi:hypothetical protein